MTHEESKAIIAAFRAKPRSEWKGFPQSKPRIALDCIHLGPAIQPVEAARLVYGRDDGVGTQRVWRSCAKGHGERGTPAGYVCNCRSASVCGPKCPDYRVS